MSEIGLFDALYSTRSMRRLKPDPVPEELLKKVIEAGIHAPSGSNLQNWAFIFLQEREDKQFIRDRYLEAYEHLERLSSIPSNVTLPPDRQRMFASAIHLAEHLHEAPVILLACTGTDFPTYANANNPKSITATLTTLHYFFEEELKKRLNIPADKEVAGLIPIGYPAGRFGPTSRAPVEQVIHWGRWDGTNPGRE